MLMVRIRLNTNKNIMIKFLTFNLSEGRIKYLITTEIQSICTPIYQLYKHTK